MAYPTSDECFKLAASLNIDPVEVFGYAAIHGKLPATPAEVGALQQSVYQKWIADGGTNGDPQWNNSKPFYYGFIASRGRIHGEWGEMLAYLQSIGAATADNRYVPGHWPQPGQGYPPGSPVDQVPTRPAPAPSPAPGGGTTSPPADRKPGTGTGPVPGGTGSTNPPNLLTKAVDLVKQYPIPAAIVALLLLKGK